MEEPKPTTYAPPQKTRGRVIRITALMAAIYLFFHFLPDIAPERPAAFLREATGDTSPELCEASSIGFMQVSQGRSPIRMRLVANGPLEAGREARVTVALERPGGRAVSISELEEKHTEKFHLLIVDPTLGDYQHKHPQPTAVPGEFVFSFTPRHGGNYRFFGEVVPVVTGRAVQAVEDLDVTGGVGPGTDFRLEATLEDYHFRLNLPEGGVRVRRPTILTFDVRNLTEGKPATLEPVMGAWTHIVAFDPERSGFAHMHPLQEGLEQKLDPVAPQIPFMFYADKAGTYTLWAQVKIEGEEYFAPFTLEVL